MLRALGDRGVSPSERIVLAAIAYHDGPGGARPGVDRLADVTGMGRRTLFTHLASLEAKERIERRQTRGTNRYRILARPEGAVPSISANLRRGNSAGYRHGLAGGEDGGGNSAEDRHGWVPDTGTVHSAEDRHSKGREGKTGSNEPEGLPFPTYVSMSEPAERSALGAARPAPNEAFAVGIADLLRRHERHAEARWEAKRAFVTLGIRERVEARRAARRAEDLAAHEDAAGGTNHEPTDGWWADYEHEEAHGLNLENQTDER